MLANDRYRNHLLEIVDEGGNPADRSALSENNLQTFFDLIALDRIRTTPTDWQGYPVSGLLWNLPDLKAAGKAALSGHIRNRWQDFCKSVVSQAPEPQGAGKKPDEPQPTENQAAEEPGKKMAVEIAANEPSEPLPFLTGTANIRRDWFDRLTDWVAALVTLWK